MQELSDSRIMKTVEISTLDSSVREDYDQRLADTLKDLRDQYETQMKMSSEEIISIYEKKVNKNKRSSTNHVFCCCGF